MSQVETGLSQAWLNEQEGVVDSMLAERTSGATGEISLFGVSVLNNQSNQSYGAPSRESLQRVTNFRRQVSAGLKTYPPSEWRRRRVHCVGPLVNGPMRRLDLSTSRRS